MGKHRGIGVLLMLFGLVSLILVTLWLPDQAELWFPGRESRMIGQPAISSAGIAVGGIGLIGIGAAWVLGPVLPTSVRRGLPAVVLMFVAATVSAGTVILFAGRDPTAPSGFFLLAGLFVVAVMAGVIYVSYRWLQTGTTARPLAGVVGAINVGLFHRYAQVYHPQLTVGLVALIVFILGFGPVICIRYDVVSLSLGE